MKKIDAEDVLRLLNLIETTLAPENTVKDYEEHNSAFKLGVHKALEEVVCISITAFRKEHGLMQEQVNDFDLYPELKII